jgi:hypothetical protein
MFHLHQTYFIITLKPAKIDDVILHNFIFFYLSSQEMHINFLTLSMHITEEKKRVARGTEGKHQSG